MLSSVRLTNVRHFRLFRRIRIPLINPDREIQISTQNLKEPKGFGNFGKKNSEKNNPEKSNRSDGRRARRKEKESEAETENEPEPEPEPNKNPKNEKEDKKGKSKKEKKDSGKIPFLGDFEGEPNWVTGFYAFCAGVVGSFLYEQGMIGPGSDSTQNEFLSDVNKGKVNQIQVRNRELGIYSPIGTTQTKSFQIGSIDQLEDSIRRIEEKNDIDIDKRIVINYTTAMRPWSVITNNMFMLGLLGYFLFRQAKGGSSAFIQTSRTVSKGGKGGKGAKGKKKDSSPMDFMGGGPMGQKSKSTAVVIDPEDIDVRFADVAGCEESKEEIMEFVSFLKHPQNYEALGAKIPKGAILNGPPGTGKTLLGKATAGEAGVTFMSVNGSEFQEMFVGVGASRVRDTFEKARDNAPCILFIDEIDALGRKRGSRMGSSESDSTLNQLLTEMDGFNSIGDQVIVMAATNRVDTLDDALLRPGRFDRQIYVGAPDIKGRAEILKIHLKDKKIDKDLNIDELSKKIAARTPGMAGADLANVTNEGALMAARANKKSISFDDFNSAIDRVIAGIEKKSNVIKPLEKEKIAHHEAGHAVTGWFLEHADPLVKVTIVPRGKALGFAMYQPSDLNLMPEEQILDRISVSLGGRAAEKLFFDSVTTGASDDLDKVTKMAYSMVTQYGFSKKIGQVNFSQMSDGYNKPYSEETGKLIDAEVKKIIDQQWDRTLNLLTEKKDILQNLAKVLLEKETIERQDLIDILGERPFKEMTTYEEYIADTKAKDSDSSPKTLDDMIPKNKEE